MIIKFEIEQERFNDWKNIKIINIKEVDYIHPLTMKNYGFNNEPILINDATFSTMSYTIDTNHDWKSSSTIVARLFIISKEYKVWLREKKLERVLYGARPTTTIN